LVVLTATLALRAEQSTVKDGVYTKAQADGAKALWEKGCARCHTLGDLSTAPADKGPVLSGDAFLTKWNGKTLFELVDGIQKNMPNDFSMELTGEQAADVTALILQVNGFPAGAKALAPGDALKQITITK
jgi:mono/diheme cytochrome c family protein